MRLTELLGKKRILLLAFMFVLSSILLVSCSGSGTTASTKDSGTTRKSGETTEKSVEKAEGKEQTKAQSEESITPEPTPAPTPEPTSPVVQEVKCGIGAFNVLNCSDPAGEQFSCSGGSSAVGSPYDCTNSLGDKFGCEVVASRMGGFTLSCTRLLQ